MDSKQKMEALIGDLAVRAANEAEKAWAEALAKGKIGEYRLPLHKGGESALNFGGQLFKMGYALAIMDHVQHSSRQVFDAQDQEMRWSATEINGRIMD